MKTFILVCLTLLQSLAFADLDKDQQEGLSNTKSLLRSPKQREDFIKTDKRAQETDAKVDALAGSSANKESIYDISADVMDKLTIEANGDPDKMQKILLEAQTNPKAFYEKYFDAKAKAKVSDVAGKIERQPTRVDPRK